MQCELCGTNKGEFSKAIIEGSILEVCHRCSRFGAVIEQHAEEQPEPQSQPRQAYQSYHYSESAEHIDTASISRIKQAREKKHLTQEELANAIAEKLSVIQKIESGSLTPPVKLCKKLEQFLQVKLILAQPPQTKEEKKQLDLRNQKLTIGDLLSLKFHAHKKDPGT